LPAFEICPDCYKKYFLSCVNMEMEISEHKHKCCGCGKIKYVVRKVKVNGEVIDIN